MKNYQRTIIFCPALESSTEHGLRSLEGVQTLTTGSPPKNYVMENGKSMSF